jgi:hypothetical protein
MSLWTTRLASNRTPEVIMATADERRALLAIACPHCDAWPGSLCTTSFAHRRRKFRDDEPMTRRVVRPPRTLDGGFHDARWQAALGRSAEVVGDVVAEVVAEARAGV